MKKIFNIFIGSYLLCFVGIAHANDFVKWSLPETQKPDEEFLLYRLSYSGFFTAFIWKDIADMVIVADDESFEFNNQKNCQLHLRLSTENFLISELVYPMRFHWRTTVSSDLRQVRLVEELKINQDADSHKLVWLNQKKKRLEFYHKRQKVSERVDDDVSFYEDDEAEESITQTMVWEKDGKKQAPDFLVDKPELAPGLNYLVYDKSVKIRGSESVYDPLSLIYSARWYDYNQIDKVDYTVTYKDTFRKYQVRFAGKEKLEIGGKTVNAFRVEVRRNKEESRSVEGFMDIWFSDDERRIPLKYFVKVKTGTIRLALNTSNLKNYQMPVNCINRDSF